MMHFLCISHHSSLLARVSWLKLLQVNVCVTQFGIDLGLGGMIPLSYTNLKGKKGAYGIFRMKLKNENNLVIKKIPFKMTWTFNAV